MRFGAMARVLYFNQSLNAAAAIAVAAAAVVVVVPTAAVVVASVAVFAMVVYSCVHMFGMLFVCKCCDDGHFFCQSSSRSS